MEKSEMAESLMHVNLNGWSVYLKFKPVIHKSESLNSTNRKRCLVVNNNFKGRTYGQRESSFVGMQYVFQLISQQRKKKKNVPAYGQATTRIIRICFFRVKHRLQQFARQN